MTIASKQFHELLRTTKPTFVAAVATTHGELSTDLIHLMEWIVAAYKSSLANAPPRADGRKPEQLSAIFRQHLRQKVLMAVAKGTARILRDAGLGKTATRKYMRN